MTTEYEIKKWQKIAKIKNAICKHHWAIAVCAKFWRESNYLFIYLLHNMYYINYNIINYHIDIIF